jgi:transposase
VERLLALLLRYVGGERAARRAVRVPSEEDEHRRQLHRELLALKRDRTRVTNRITGLLATQGVHVSVRADFRDRLERFRLWNGHSLPDALRMRLVREWEKVELFTTQVRALEHARREAVRHANEPAVALVRRLRELRGIGDHAAWLFVMELFAWRQLKRARKIGIVAVARRLMIDLWRYLEAGVIPEGAVLKVTGSS